MQSVSAFVRSETPEWLVIGHINAHFFFYISTVTRDTVLGIVYQSSQHLDTM
jgi:hypothetical protein